MARVPVTAAQVIERFNAALSHVKTSGDLLAAVDQDILRDAIKFLQKMEEGIPMILFCPSCNGRHIDEGEFATRNHHSHACQKCGLVWRPAIVATTGVQFLPGFKSEAR